MLIGCATPHTIERLPDLSADFDLELRQWIAARGRDHLRIAVNARGAGGSVTVDEFATGGDGNCESVRRGTRPLPNGAIDDLRVLILSDDFARLPRGIHADVGGIETRLTLTVGSGMKHVEADIDPDYGALQDDSALHRVIREMKRAALLAGLENYRSHCR
jgi:hypothetical protein